MPSAPEPPNPLENFLKEAESELSRRLHEACEAEARGVATESAREIRQLEDSLLSAAMAAEQVIKARRHLRRASGDAETPSGDTTPAADPDRTQSALTSAPKPGEGTGSPAASTGTAVREFEDETGRSWRAWPVTPNLARAQEASRRSLGDFQDGWICFEALDNSGRRRLPSRGRRWSDLPAEDLPRLLEEAIDVPGRKTRRADAPGDPDRGAVH